MSQSNICPECSSYMDFVKDNQWLKCRSCSYMVKVKKRTIQPTYSFGPGTSDVDDFNAF